MVAQAVPPTTIRRDGKSKKAPTPTPIFMEMTNRPTDDNMPITVATSMGVHLENPTNLKNRPGNMAYQALKSPMKIFSNLCA
jgi:hypothetical protein